MAVKARRCCQQGSRWKNPFGMVGGREDTRASGGGKGALRIFETSRRPRISFDSVAEMEFEI